MLGDDLADVLSTAGLGTVGTDIFVGDLPDMPAQAIAVRETGGLFPLHNYGAGPTGTFGAGAAVIERPRVQVVSRAAEYATARAKAGDVFNVLDGRRSFTVNGVLYHYVTAVQSPIDIGPDANGRRRFVMNFDIQKSVSSSTST